MRLVLFVYSLLMTVGIALAVPLLALRRLFGGKKSILEGLGERLGSVKPPVTKDSAAKPPRTLWLHCVSVGEVMAARGLVAELAARHPDRPICVSTVTAAGRSVAARELAGVASSLFFAPLDHPWAVRRALDRIRPSLVILFETEIWPNLVHLSNRAGASVAVVNGRLSDRSYPRYRLARPFLRALLAEIALFLMQSKHDAERVCALGADAGRVHVVPNLKWGVASRNGREPREWRQTLGIPLDRKVFVAGSTCAGEETLVWDAFAEARAGVPDMTMVLAPRKPDRFRAVEQLLRERSPELAVRSRGERGGSVILLDTIGELPSVYAIADAVFVGGSLVDAGGHNLLEPAACGKAVLFGPYVSNFREMSRLLLDHGAACQVRSSGELARALRRLLGNPTEAAGMGRAALELVASQAGAAARTAELLAPLIDSDPRLGARIGAG